LRFTAAAAAADRGVVNPPPAAATAELSCPEDGLPPPDLSPQQDGGGGVNPLRARWGTYRTLNVKAVIIIVAPAWMKNSFVEDHRDASRNTKGEIDSSIGAT